MSNQNTRAFSEMRPASVDFGSGMARRCRHQRMHSWATVQPYEAAMSTSSWFSSTRPAPSGDQASTTMSLRLQKSRVASWLQPGCSSIWFTMGSISAALMRGSRWWGLKLLVPMARTWPSR